MKIKVMITDDQRLMREGLKTILDLEDDLTVVQLCENGKDTLEKLPSVRPDVILMDIRMPIMDGVECTRIIKQQYPEVKILILTTFDDDEFIIDALKNGAVGYILKDLSSEKLVSSIRDAYKGNSIMQPEIAAKVISHISESINYSDFKSMNKDSQEISIISKEVNTKLKLTNREREILNLVGEGMSNTEIAKKLYISVGTVKNYISNLYSKLEVEDRSKLTLYAIKENSSN
ncbi:two component transcriptional regulator, LuxR family protein [Clostridium sartagoforme AAU1]|uniref:Stage 0 sporulation protein A homolog n=1 Tax=Clostridium sartagoforme AAU1 TaxID=1202534 RepID=R9CC51_9CLOT|nr:response regulator transcription factor [Clostridium sartagoforme]EOR26949.1 two component transcriptional regulator, LuxR family protein [Clostridium sartagoforme AAU1]